MAARCIAAGQRAEELAQHGQPWSSQASMPSLTARAAMARAAMGSAHHQPSQAFRPRPSRVAAEVSAQNAVSAESAIKVRLPSARPGAALCDGQQRYDDQRGRSHREPGG